MSRSLNTEHGPRFVLDVDAAAAWLVAVEKGTHLARYDAPSAYDLVLPADFQLYGGDSAVDLLELSGALLRTATELGIVSAPDWVQANLEDLGDGEIRLVLTAPELWGDLAISGLQPLLQDTGLPPEDRWAARGAAAAMFILGDFVRDANVALSSLVQAAEVVMAQYSTDAGLLTRLADSDEPLIRHLAAGNEAAPDEARVLAALKDGVDRDKR